MIRHYINEIQNLLDPALYEVSAGTLVATAAGNAIIGVLSKLSPLSRYPMILIPSGLAAGAATATEITSPDGIGRFMAVNPDGCGQVVGVAVIAYLAAYFLAARYEEREGA